MMFSIKDFFSKCGQILHIMIKHTLKQFFGKMQKSLIKNFIFCAV